MITTLVASGGAVRKSPTDDSRPNPGVHRPKSARTYRPGNAPSPQLSPITALPPTGTYRAELNRRRAIEHATSRYWIMLVLLAVAAPAALFFLDQRIVSPLVWGKNTARFHEIAGNQFSSVEPVDRTLILTIGGMGIKDATDSVAVPLVPAFSDDLPHSKLFALEEGARLFLPQTYKALDHLIADEPADTVVFYGMSTGTKEMLYLAAHLRVADPTVRIVLFADSGPVDAHSAYELRYNPDLIDLGRASSRLRLFGGPITNSLIDITSSPTRAKYLDDNGALRASAFWAEIARIGRDVWTRDGTPTSLRIGQLALIVDDSALANMRTIGGTTDSPQTWFFYLAPGNDGTVDDTYALEKYRQYANQINAGTSFHFVDIHLPELPHASERRYPEPYNRAITNALNTLASFD